MKYQHLLMASIFLWTSLFTFSACDLVELDEAPVPVIEAPVGLPANLADFTFALASTESRTWKTLGFRLEGLNGFQSCRLDDTFIFFVDGTYRYDGGTTLCGGADDRRIKTGIWEVEIDNATIVFDRDTNIEYSASILGLNNGKIQLTGEVDIFGRSMDIEGIYEEQVSN